MIPFIEIQGDNSVDVNTDLVILDDSKPILISACDIAIKTKKLASDLISDNWTTLILRDRENIQFEQRISIYDNKFRYKSNRQGELTHTIIHSTNINNYIIDWNNEGKVKSVTKYLQNRLYKPITEEIVAKIIRDDYKYIDSLLKPLDIYTNNPIFKDLEAYYLNDHWFNEELEKLDLFAEEDTFDWDEIKGIEDYLITFSEPIINKLKENIKVLYDSNNIDMRMFEGKKKPFRGQVPIIQSGIEVLKKDRFVYINAEQGMGKTILAPKINHCHMKKKNKDNYITLCVVPAITLSQWKQELKDSIGEKIDVIVFRKTIDFIKWHNQTNMKVDKPTYILVGKETFKLDYKKRPAYVKRAKYVEYKKKELSTGYWRNYETINKKEEIKHVLCCPNCGIPLKNPLRTTEDVFFTEKDFKGNPKKSNYKCVNCESLLWQGTYDKTKKTSIINYIKVKNIRFDSIICDEIHESNKSSSIIGNATRTLFNYANKIILLSGTSNNGYASSMHNILLGLLSNKLKDDKVLDIKDFVRKYGTLQAITKKKDGEHFSYGRSEIRDSDWKEVEGINSLVFTKYLSQNYIFATLDDLEKEYPELDYVFGKENPKVLPNLYEYYVPIQHNKEIMSNANELINDFKQANSLNHAWYDNSIVKHYINNPYNWSEIEVGGREIAYKIQPINIKNEDILLPKEEKLLEIVDKEVKEGRKVWIYTEFTGGGQYMKGVNIPNRLEKILNNKYKVYQLKPSVSTYDRKDVIEKNKDKYDVFISNPRLVQVGINMSWCPNFIVYTPSYQVNIIEQSIRRGMRANSTEDNHIYHLYYENTIEHIVCERYQLKKAESKAIEGKFNVDVNVKRTASSLGKKISDGMVKQ